MISRLWMKKVFGAFLVIAITASGLLWVLGQEREIIITVPPFQGSSQQVPAANSFNIYIPPEHNITKQTAEGISQELVAKNQTGPQETEQGLFISLNPAESLKTMLHTVEQIPYQPFSGIEISDLVIASQDSSGARRAYFETLQVAMIRILGSANEQPNLQEVILAALAQDTSQIESLIQRYNNAIVFMREMQMPSSLAVLHKQATDLLMKTEIMLRAMATAAADPMRAHLAWQTYPILVEETQEFQKKFTDAIKREYIGQNFWNRMFVSKAAYAFFPGVPIPLPTFEWNQLLTNILPRDIREYVERIITEFSKDRILSYMRDRVLQYIRGQNIAPENCPNPYFAPDGRTLCPQFVMNWEQMLFRAQSEAKARLAQEINQSNIPESHRRMLLAVADPPAGAYGTTFNTLVQDAQRCEDTGDPVAYMLCRTDFVNSFEMQFIAAIQRGEELRTRYEEGRKAARVAADGFTGTEKCVQFEERDGAIVLDAQGQPRCIEWVTTKPGALPAEAAAQMVRAGQERIVNAFDLRGVLGALMNQFINQIMQAGTEGLLGLIESGITAPPPLDPPPTGVVSVTLSVTPSHTIPEGSSAVISWEAQHAVTCSASGAWSGPRHTSGSETVTPVETSTYTLTCSDQWNLSHTASVTITVISPPDPAGP
jgi:hypothetical protein